MIGRDTPNDVVSEFRRAVNAREPRPSKQPASKNIEQNLPHIPRHVLEHHSSVRKR